MTVSRKGPGDHAGHAGGRHQHADRQPRPRDLAPPVQLARGLGLCKYISLKLCYFNQRLLLAPGLPSPVSISLLMLVTASTSASSSGTQVITLKPWYSFRSHFVGLKIANDVKTMHESKAAHKCTAITRYNIIWWKTIYIVDFCLASYSTLLGGSSIQRKLREHGPSVRLCQPTL